MALKQKMFRIHSTLAAAFEAWCETRAMKQEQAAEASLFHLIHMPPDQREKLFVSLAEWKANLKSEPASGTDAGAAVAAALQRQRKGKRRSKRPPSRQSA